MQEKKVACETLRSRDLHCYKLLTNIISSNSSSSCSSQSSLQCSRIIFYANGIWYTWKQRDSSFSNFHCQFFNNDLNLSWDLISRLPPQAHFQTLFWSILLCFAQCTTEVWFPPFYDQYIHVIFAPPPRSICVSIYFFHRIFTTGFNILHMFSLFDKGLRWPVWEESGLWSASTLSFCFASLPLLQVSREVCPRWPAPHNASFLARPCSWTFLFHQYL